jgi:hypothetical protein
MMPSVQDAEESPITLSVFLNDWYPAFFGQRCAVGDAQERALRAVVWDEPPTFEAWCALVKWFGHALDAAARAALAQPPTTRGPVDRFQLASGCVVHRVAAWSKPAEQSRPLHDVMTVEQACALPARPHASRVRALASWRETRTHYRVQRGVYEAMAWSAQPVSSSWLYVTRGISGGLDLAEWAAACRRARARGRTPPTMEELTNEEIARSHAAAKRAWARYVAKRAASLAPKKKGARHG